MQRSIQAYGDKQNEKLRWGALRRGDKLLLYVTVKIKWSDLYPEIDLSYK